MDLTRTTGGSGGAVNDRYPYGYDRDSNRLWRDKLRHAAFGNLSVNDSPNALTLMQRGTLNSGHTALTGLEPAGADDEWDDARNEPEPFLSQVLAATVSTGCETGPWWTVGVMMNYDILVSVELGRHPWSCLTQVDGPATDVPVALQQLLAADTADEVSRAYWNLENHVVVQGQLFEAAVGVVSVLLAALVDPGRPTFVRIGLLELLFQIVKATTHEDERQRGIVDIDIKCKEAARAGLWLLYREYLTGERAAAEEVIQVLDVDASRLTALKQMLKMQ